MTAADTDRIEAFWIFRRYRSASRACPCYDEREWDALEERMAQAGDDVQKERRILDAARLLFERKGAPQELSEVYGKSLADFQLLSCAWLWIGSRQVCFKDTHEQVVCDANLITRIIKSLPPGTCPRDLMPTKSMLVNVKFGYGFILDARTDVSRATLRRVLLAQELEEYFSRDEHPFSLLVPSDW